MTASLPPPRLLPSGDAAITVEFSRNIDEQANRRVLALDRALADTPIDGVTETVPTYRSLLVHYDPVQIGFEQLGERLIAFAQLPVPLTTQHQNCSDIGAMALATMLQRLENPGLPTRDVLLQTHTVVRKSCGTHLAGHQKTS